MDSGVTNYGVNKSEAGYCLSAAEALTIRDSVLDNRSLLGQMMTSPILMWLWSSSSPTVLCLMTRQNHTVSMRQKTSLLFAWSEVMGVLKKELASKVDV
jgi:hypothetical protein